MDSTLTISCFDTMSYSWFRSLFAFAFLICINRAISKSELTQDSYTKHCSLVIPRYHITNRSSDRDSLPSLSTSYFTGGDRFRPARKYRPEHDVSKNLRLRLRPDHYQTTAAGVYSVEGFLYVTFSYGRDDPKLRFPMSGFWSQKSRNLCMVGVAAWKGGDLDAVLKLKFDGENPTVYTAVVSGSLESTASADDPAYFDPIFIFDFPTAVSDYTYSLVPRELGGGAPPVWKDDSLSLDSIDFCRLLEGGLRLLSLEYPPECAERRRSRRCSPVGFGDELLPNNLALISIQCDKRSKMARFLARFQNSSNYGYYNFPISSTAIGEAWWDYTSNRIIGAACGISNPFRDLGFTVGDCSMRLRLRLPSILTMRNHAKIVGEIWSAEGVEDSGYFTPIRISNYEGAAPAPADYTGQRYEYREVDRVRESCREKMAGKKGKEYADGQSDGIMRFDLSIANGDGKYLGSAYFMAVRSENYADPVLDLPLFDRKSNTGELKMRYKITVYPSSSSSSSSSNGGNSSSESSLDWPLMESYVAMRAEGVYDRETGQLCMVGCRKLALNSVSSFDDCEVVVELEVPPWNERREFKGIIGSTRPPTDALHFDDLVIYSEY